MGQSCTRWCTRVPFLEAGYPGLLLSISVRSWPPERAAFHDAPTSGGSSVVAEKGSATEGLAKVSGKYFSWVRLR
jgi:hypothetical protein